MCIAAVPEHADFAFQSGRTPALLAAAASANRESLLEILVKAGANLDIADAVRCAVRTNDQ